MLISRLDTKSSQSSTVATPEKGKVAFVSLMRKVDGSLLQQRDVLKSNHAVEGASSTHFMLQTTNMLWLVPSGEFWSSLIEGKIKGAVAGSLALFFLCVCD